MSAGKCGADRALSDRYQRRRKDAPHKVSRRLRPLIEGGVVATTASLDAEALYSARGPADYEQLWADRRAAYEFLPTNDEHWQSALGVQRALATTGQHRAVGMADLFNSDPRRRAPTHSCSL
jgi:predicted nucleic acid-binding protein